MALSSSLKPLATALALMLPALPAHAETFLLDLTGTVSTGVSQTVVGGGNQFDVFTIALNNFSPLTVAVGDVIDATITFDQVINVPIGGLFNAVDFALIDTVDGTAATATSGTSFRLFLSGVEVASGTDDATSTGALFGSYLNFGGTTLSYNSIRTSFTVASLGAPSLSLDAAVARSIVVNPVLAAVPEPAAWALMILGFGAIGSALRRRRHTSLVTA